MDIRLLDKVPANVKRLIDGTWNDCVKGLSNSQCGMRYVAGVIATLEQMGVISCSEGNALHRYYMGWFFNHPKVRVI